MIRLLHIVSLLILCVLTSSIVFAQSQTQSKMLNTKHNLGIGGSGTIKATNEADICVFCHTPHVPKQYAAEQLWNHQLSTANYTLYSSDYLTSLNYATPNQPNPRSKLCLSCHDGTVAIGAVYNNYGPRTISMQNSVTTMPTDAAGNLGTSLKNDHPVGYIYDNTKDPELVSRSWPWKTAIKLDPDLGSGTLECITCHEPHDNSFGKFLRIDNTNAALCAFCHTKTGWANAIHKTSMQSYTPPDGAATTLGEWSCRTCHQSHGGEGIPYLLKSVEENTCFGSGCHGKTNTGLNTKNLQSEYDKNYNHPTVSVFGKHKNPDDANSLGTANRHAECQDCHNSHQAQKGLHTVGGNGISNVLTGVRGVMSGPTNIWEQPTTYTEITLSTEENQICMKCHSSYAFGQVLNGVVTSILGPSGTQITDQAMEFNPANHSAHPVRFSSSSQTGSPIPRPLAASQMTTDWAANVGVQTMYCSDCHGNDESVSSTVPQGPHGSNAKFMLTGRGKYWPSKPPPDGTLWSLADVKNNATNWQNDLFCANCHTLYNGVSFQNNVHSALQHQDPSVKCITCHVTVPHGSKRSRLIGYANDVAPYNYSGIGLYDKLVITGFQKSTTGPLNYFESNCSMVGTCHGTQIGSYEQ
jgi:predicted CXXCH cytochrome family protein